MSNIRFSVLAASLALLAVLADAATAMAPPRVTVVYQGGRTASSVLAAGEPDARTKANDACQGDAAVLFAFTETPAASNRDIDRLDGGGVIAVDVRIACSRLAGQLMLEYASSSAPAGAKYHVNPTASVQLPTTQGASELAMFSVDIIDTAYGGVEEFGVRRSGGQFSGEFEGALIMGAIQPAATELFRIRITGGGVPATPPSGLNGLADDPYASSIYLDLQRFCSKEIASNRSECRALATLAANADADPQALDNLVQVLRALSPEKTTPMGATANQIMTGQLENVALRVAELVQGGGRGFSTSGLSLVGGGMPLSLGMLGDALNRANEDENEEKRTLLGGTRWGVWLNGAIGGGDKSRRGGNPAFDFDNWALTAGVDYRVLDTTFLGAAIGFSRFSADFDGVRDSLDADGRTLHLYGGYSAPNGLSLDGSLSWMRTSYDLVRYLPGPGSTDLTVRDYLTRSSPDARQYSGAFGLSWYFQREAWTLAPTLQYEFLRSRIDAFEEGGDSLFRLAYGERDIVTRSLSFGFYGDVSFATQVGTFRPYLRALRYADSGSGPRNLLAHFVEGGIQAPINSVIQAEGDRDYATLELGLGFRRPIGARTVDFNLGVMKLLQFTAVDRWAARFDLRVPF